jgi:hypothetical protein
VTAYVAWSLIEAGHGDAPEVGLAVEHLERYPDKAGDPYVLALVANALVAYAQVQPGPPHADSANDVLARLAEMAEADGYQAAWYGESETFSGAVGDAADIERTALAMYALLRSESHPRLAAQGLTWLVGRRDGFGLWGSHPTNWLVSRTLWAAARTQSPFIASTFHVSVAESDVRSIDVRSQETGPAPHLVYNELVKGYNDVVLSAEGMGPVPYRIVGTYVLPWNQVEPSLPEGEALSIEVGYDRTEVTVGEAITATVDATLNRPGPVRLAVLELGLPPGLEPLEREWDELVERGIIARYRRDGERMVVHLDDLSAQEPVRFTYHLQAQFPLSVRTLPTRAYDAANPGQAAVREPLEITVLPE